MSYGNYRTQPQLSQSSPFLKTWLVLQPRSSPSTAISWIQLQSRLTRASGGGSTEGGSSGYMAQTSTCTRQRSAHRSNSPRVLLSRKRGPRLVAHAQVHTSCSSRATMPNHGHNRCCSKVAMCQPSHQAPARNACTPSPESLHTQQTARTRPHHRQWKGSPEMLVVSHLQHTRALLCYGSRTSGDNHRRRNEQRYMECHLACSTRSTV